MELRPGPSRKRVCPFDTDFEEVINQWYEELDVLLSDWQNQRIKLLKMKVAVWKPKTFFGRNKFRWLYRWLTVVLERQNATLYYNFQDIDHLCAIKHQ